MNSVYHPSSLLRRLLGVCCLSLWVHEGHGAGDNRQAPGDQQGQVGVPGAHDALVLEWQEDGHVPLECHR